MAANFPWRWTSAAGTLVTAWRGLCCRLLIMLGDGLRCKVLCVVFSQRIGPMPLQEILQTPFYNNNKKKRKTYQPVARKKNRRKQVVVEYQRMVPVDQLLPIKNEVSGTFSFTCPATALPVSYHRGQTFCTALSTWSPRSISRDHQLLPFIFGGQQQQKITFSSIGMRPTGYVGLMPIELNVIFCCCCPPKINGSNSKWSLLCVHNLEKKKKKREKKGKELWRYKHYASRGTAPL